MGAGKGGTRTLKEGESGLRRKFAGRGLPRAAGDGLRSPLLRPVRYFLVHDVERVFFPTDWRCLRALAGTKSREEAVTAVLASSGKLSGKEEELEKHACLLGMGLVVLRLGEAKICQIESVVG